MSGILGDVLVGGAMNLSRIGTIGMSSVHGAIPKRALWDSVALS